MSNSTQLILLAGTWVLYGVLHSLLAANRCKDWVRKTFPNACRGYRLTYNVLAAILLLPPLWLMAGYSGENLLSWNGLWQWAANLLVFLAIGGFILSLRFYDSGEFLGLRQLSGKHTAIDELPPMSLSWMHRYVRHPWYFFGLIIIWTHDMNAAFLITAVCLSLYLIVGSKLEENKLVLSYGDQYRVYMQRVPGLIPLPWRFLHKDQADTIIDMKKSG